MKLSVPPTIRNPGFLRKMCRKNVFEQNVYIASSIFRFGRSVYRLQKYVSEFPFKILNLRVNFMLFWAISKLCSPSPFVILYFYTHKNQFHFYTIFRCKCCTLYRVHLLSVVILSTQRKTQSKTTNYINKKLYIENFVVYLCSAQ